MRPLLLVSALAAAAAGQGTTLPTAYPDRVVLTWAGDPTTTQAVSWRTAPGGKAAVAELARATDGPTFEATKRSLSVASTPHESEGVAAVYHTAEITGLSPSTKYLYRVGAGTTFTEWHAFTTAADTTEPFGFIYLGDAQNDIKRHWSRVVRGAYSDMPKAKFILHAGDLINRGLADAEWGEWHGAAGWINATVPVVATPGNHEYGGQPPAKVGPPAPGDAKWLADWAVKRGGLSTHWRSQFAFPQNGPPGLEETTYFFDFQGVRFVSLNSNEQLELQVPWLEWVLANNPHRWTVVTFHHPVYSTAVGRDNKRVRDLWRPVFDKYAVDLVLQGHDHSYGRSGLMREDNELTGTAARDASGTVYVVSVSGPKQYSVTVQPWMESSGKGMQLYQLIRIDGDHLHYEARTATGALYDEFVLTKHRGRGNELTAKAGTAEKTSSDRGVIAAAVGGMLLAGVLIARRR